MCLHKSVANGKSHKTRNRLKAPKLEVVTLKARKLEVVTLEVVLILEEQVQLV